MISDPLFYVLAVLAVLLVGVSKGGFGGGVGLLAVPLMSLAVSPVQAAAVMLPILCVMDLVALRAFHGKWSADNLVTMLPGALAGIALGAILFRTLRPSDIKLVIGVMALAFVATQTRVLLSVSGAAPEPRRHVRAVGGVFWGGLSGFSSFLAHAGGPPASIHLLPQRLDKAVYQGTTVLFFMAMNLVKLVPYAALGLFRTDLLLTSLVLLPLAPLGVWLGVHLHNRIDQRWFYRICIAGLGLIGLKLAWEGLEALL